MEKKQKTKKEKVKVSWASRSENRDIAKKYIKDSPNDVDIKMVVASSPMEANRVLHTCLFRDEKPADREEISLAEYCHNIYGWLILNPRMCCVSDYYDYPNTNAPFIYTLDEVIEYDSDEIYNLLQKRIAKMMARKQLDRDSALAILRQEFGWQRDQQEINLNTNGNIRFKFGNEIALPSDSSEDTEDTEK